MQTNTHTQTFMFPNMVLFQRLAIVFTLIAVVLSIALYPSYRAQRLEDRLAALAASDVYIALFDENNQPLPLNQQLATNTVRVTAQVAVGTLIFSITCGPSGGTFSIRHQAKLHSHPLSTEECEQGMQARFEAEAKTLEDEHSVIPDWLRDWLKNPEVLAQLRDAIKLYR